MFHHRVVYAHIFRCRVRLNDEDITTTNRFFKAAFDFAISEINNSWVPKFNTQVAGDVTRESRVCPARE